MDTLTVIGRKVSNDSDLEIRLTIAYNHNEYEINFIENGKQNKDLALADGFAVHNMNILADKLIEDDVVLDRETAYQTIKDSAQPYLNTELDANLEEKMATNLERYTNIEQEGISLAESLDKTKMLANFFKENGADVKPYRLDDLTSLRFAKLESLGAGPDIMASCLRHIHNTTDWDVVAKEGYEKGTISKPSYLEYQKDARLISGDEYREQKRELMAEIKGVLSEVAERIHEDERIIQETTKLTLDSYNAADKLNGYKPDESTMDGLKIRLERSVQREEAFSKIIERLDIMVSPDKTNKMEGMEYPEFLEKSRKAVEGGRGKLTTQGLIECLIDKSVGMEHPVYGQPIKASCRDSIDNTTIRSRDPTKFDKRLAERYEPAYVEPTKPATIDPAVAKAKETGISL